MVNKSHKFQFIEKLIPARWFFTAEIFYSAPNSVLSLIIVAFLLCLQEKRESWIKTLANKTPQNVRALQAEEYSSIRYDEEADEDYQPAPQRGRKLPPIPDEDFETTAIYDTIDDITPQQMLQKSEASLTPFTDESESLYEDIVQSDDKTSEPDISPYGVYYTSKALKEKKKFAENEDVYDDVPEISSTSDQHSSIPMIPPPPSPDVIKELMYPSVSPPKEYDLPQTLPITSRKSESSDLNNEDFEDKQNLTRKVIKSTSDESYEDMELNNEDSDSDTYEIPNPDEEECEHPELAESQPEDSNCYTYVDSSDQAATRTVPLDIDPMHRSGSFGHLKRSVSAGQLIIPPHIQQQADQNLQLNILIEMHQMLAQMQATYTQSISLTSQTGAEKSVNPYLNDENCLSSFSDKKDGDGDDIKSKQVDKENSAMESLEAANTKINMKKCLG